MKGTSSRLSQGHCLGAGDEGPLFQFTAPSYTPARSGGAVHSVSPRKQLLWFLCPACSVKKDFHMISPQEHKPSGAQGFLPQERLLTFLCIAPDPHCRAGALLSFCFN